MKTKGFDSVVRLKFVKMVMVELIDDHIQIGVLSWNMHG